MDSKFEATMYSNTIEARNLWLTLSCEKVWDIEFEKVKGGFAFKVGLTSSDGYEKQQYNILN